LSEGIKIYLSSLITKVPVTVFFSNQFSSHAAAVWYHWYAHFLNNFSVIELSI